MHQPLFIPQVSGRWRLLDPTEGALSGGYAAFFEPPEAFVYRCLPMQVCTWTC
jgi:hypothetical protein